MSQISRPQTILGPLSVHGVLALTGIAAPVVFAITNLVAAFSAPNYSFIRDSISSLAWTPLGWVQTIGFLFMGLLVECFTIGLLLNIRGVREFKVGATIMVFFGFGALLIGAFHTDPAGGPSTLEGTIHRVAAALVFWLFPIACLLIAPTIREKPLWKDLFVYTIVANGFALAFLIARIGLPSDLSWFGLYERILAFDEFLWLEIIAIRLLRISLRQVRASKKPAIAE